MYRKTYAGAYKLAIIILALAVLASAAISKLRTGAQVEGFEAATVLYVVDGDTICVRTSAGNENLVRLIGIDCPESVNPDETKNTPEGKLASEFTSSLLKRGDTVYMARDVSDTDKYGRWLRYVWLEVPENPKDVAEVKAKMLQGIILSTGHAVAKKYTPDTAYATIFTTIEHEALA